MSCNLPLKFGFAKFDLGIPLYYYRMGRKLFGESMKYSLYRLGHFPEWYLRKHLYLDYSNGHVPKYIAPDVVQIPEERKRVELPVLG